MKDIVCKSKLLILKADALCLFEKSRKKFRFEEILNEVPNHHRQNMQDYKTII